MQIKDIVTGISRLSDEEKSSLPDHEFRGKVPYAIRFDNAGTFIFPLTEEEVCIAADRMANKIPLEIEVKFGQ